jgi:hypothetical protein
LLVIKLESISIISRAVACSAGGNGERKSPEHRVQSARQEVIARRFEEQADL